MLYLISIYLLHLIKITCGQDQSITLYIKYIFYLKIKNRLHNYRMSLSVNINDLAI